VDQPSATRTELLARRAQIALAERGRSLLEEKRNALLRELRKTVDVVLAGSDALESAATAARWALGVAEALDGPEAVRSAAVAGAGDVFIEAGTTAVMGVRVPEIRRRPIARARTARGYALATTSARVDAVAERFEAELDIVLDIAASEFRLRRLAAEVARTTRRASALESIVLPRLRAERDRIRVVLEERDREDRFRLLRVKARRMAAGRRGA
jgi:V/A-type H+-transporting ATPase subunit D